MRRTPKLLLAALLAAAPAVPPAHAQRAAGSEGRILQQAESLFADAVSARAAGDKSGAERLFREAGREYRSVLRITPNHPLALGRLGAVHYQLGEYAEGVALLRPVVSAAAAGTAEPELAWQLALCLAGGGDHKGALPHLEDLAKRQPDRHEVRLFLARSYFGAGQPRRAIEAGHDYLKLRPKELESEDAAILRLIAHSGFLSGQHGLAIEPLRALLKGDEKNPRTVRNLAVALAAAGKGAEALSTLGGLGAQDLDTPESWDARAWIQLKLGQGREALQAVGRLEGLLPGLDKHPRRASLEHRALVLGAAAYAMSGSRDEALRRYRRALEVAPKDADAHHELALLLRGDAAQALRHFAEAAGHAPEIPIYCLDHGAALRRAGQVQAAISEHQRCVDLDGDSIAAHLELAADLLAVWNESKAAPALDRAVEIYQRALDTRDQDQRLRQLARAGLVTALQARATARLRPAAAGELDLDGAAKDLEAALELDKGSAEVARNLGVVRLIQKRPADAIAVLKPHGASRDLAALLARAQVESGDLEGAAATLTQAPNPASAAHVIEQINVLLRLNRTEEAARAASSARAAATPELERAIALAQLHHAAALLAGTRPDGPAQAEAALKQVPERALQGSEPAYFDGLQLLVQVRLGRRDGLQGRIQTFQKRAAPEVVQGMLGPGGMQALVSAAHYLSRNYGEAADSAQKALGALSKSASAGDASRTLKQLYGFSLLAQASRSYNRQGPRAAEKEVKRAAGVLEGSSDELSFAQAVISYAGGKKDAATRIWKRLDGRRIPEVYANLGIAADDAGDRKAAYDFYRRYVSAGGKESDRVKRWIELKERFFNFKEGP